MDKWYVYEVQFKNTELFAGPLFVKLSLDIDELMTTLDGSHIRIWNMIFKSEEILGIFQLYECDPVPKDHSVNYWFIDISCTRSYRGLDPLNSLN